MASKKRAQEGDPLPLVLIAGALLFFFSRRGTARATVEPRRSLELEITPLRPPPGTERPPERERETEAVIGSQAFTAWVQRALNHLLGANLAVDGILGTKTRNAVTTFQAMREISVDGIPGPETAAEIRQALAEGWSAAGAEE